MQAVVTNLITGTTEEHLMAVKNDVLADENYKLEQENKELRKYVRKVRKERLAAYEKAIAGNKTDGRLTFAVGFLAGMLMAFFITTIILLGGIAA